MKPLKYFHMVFFRFFFFYYIIKLNFGILLNFDNGYFADRREGKERREE